MIENGLKSGDECLETDMMVIRRLTSQRRNGGVIDRHSLPEKVLYSTKLH